MHMVDNICSGKLPMLYKVLETSAEKNLSGDRVVVVKVQ